MEPKGFRKAELKGTWRSAARLAAVPLAVAALVGLVSIWVEVGTEVVTKVLVAAGALALLCVVAWVYARLSRLTVKVTDKSIIWDLGDTRTVRRFSAIGHCEIVRPAAPGGVTVLAVVLQDGEREEFGVPPSLSPDELRSVLMQRGLIVLDVVGGAE